MILEISGGKSASGGPQCSLWLFVVPNFMCNKVIHYKHLITIYSHLVCYEKIIYYIGLFQKISTCHANDGCHRSEKLFHNTNLNGFLNNWLPFHLLNK